MDLSASGVDDTVDTANVSSVEKEKIKTPKFFLVAIFRLIWRILLFFQKVWK